jgi:alpha-D-ribose 1-methylphosphonate 5-triphosphate synthase subunit PhnH
LKSAPVFHFEIEQNEYFYFSYRRSNSGFGINYQPVKNAWQKTPKCRDANTFLPNDHLQVSVAMISEMDLQKPTAGFKDPVLGPQHTFRAILEAMAKPGLLVKINSKLYLPERLNAASAAICLTLFDDETPVWTDLSWNSSAVDWFQSQCGCSVVTEPCMAHFALITQPTIMPPLDDFKIGDEAHPESAATLIVQVERFDDNHDKILSGPLTKTSTHFSPVGIRSQFWKQWQLQAALFPLGVDVFFTCNDILAALPRTTQVSDPIVGQIKIKKGGSDLNRPETDRNVCA